MIVARSGILGISLSSEWRFDLILPKLSSLSLCQERLRLLSNELPVRVLLQSISSFFFDGLYSFVVAWARNDALHLLVLAVRNL